MSESPWIVEATPESFERDVFERSASVPVVVDFWADWCQPCRMLAPLLGELVEQFSGKFVLVKADTNELGQQAGEFGVQGIPAVYGVSHGQVVDFFQGLLPRDQLEHWLQRFLDSAELAGAVENESADPAGSEATYRSILDRNPNETAAHIGLARVLAGQGRDDDARAVIAQLEQRGFLEPEAEKVRAALDLKDSGGDVAELRAAAEAEPDDLQRQLRLAESLAASQEYEDALACCLAIVQKDRQGLGQEAKQLMVDMFRVLPDDSELVSDYRRKLAMALY